MTMRDLRVLKEIYATLTMNSAGFSPPVGSSDHQAWPHESFTAEVQAQTRLWRESWVMGPLRALIHKHDPAWVPPTEIDLKAKLAEKCKALLDEVASIVDESLSQPATPTTPETHSSGVVNEEDGA